MKKLLMGALGTAAMLTAAMPAAAAIITTSTQTVNFAQQLTDFNNVAKTFALFNSNLGTLLSVNIYDSYQENSTITVQNTGNSSSTGNVKTESDLTLSSSNTGQNNVISALLPTNAVYGTQRSYSLAAGQSTSVTSNSGTVNSGFQTADSSNTLASDLASFAAAGGGNGSVIANTYTQTLLGNNGGNTSASQTTYGTGVFKIYYTYDDSTATPAVPEPATWAMMIAGFGLVGLGLRRRGTALSLS